VSTTIDAAGPYFVDPTGLVKSFHSGFVNNTARSIKSGFKPLFDID
jgi:hypothetical protein